jgi:tRNA threonylcarbamoyladenosine biosynthesis protein TsaB
LCYNSLKADLPNLIFPPAHLEMQHASGVAMAAAVLAAQGETVSAADLVPNYLRLSQAERERLHQQNPDNDKLKGDS